MYQAASLAAALQGPSRHALTWPVHKGSVQAQIHWRPLDRQTCYRYYRLARQHNRTGQRDGHRGGRLGSAALRVLEALIFDFANYLTGRLDPAYEQLSRTAGIARSTVASALQTLKAAGIISWQRRCRPDTTGDRFRLVQQTNAYRLEPPSHWPGWQPPATEPPPPDPTALGMPTPPIGALEAASKAAATGADLNTTLNRLADDPTDKLATALKQLGRLINQMETTRPQDNIRASGQQTETGPTFKT